MAESLKLGDKESSDVTVRIRTESRDDIFYVHSEVVRPKCRYFAQVLESGSCIELVCKESEFDYYVIFLRLLYARAGDCFVEVWHNVANAVGVLKLGFELGCCDEIMMACLQYLESVPWEMNDEERILKTIPGLGSSALPVLARLQPVDPGAARRVLLSALQAAAAVETVDKEAQFPLSIKTSAQEQIEYMLVEDEDAPLVRVDEVVKSEFRQCFARMFRRFMATLFVSNEERTVLETASDLVWAAKVLPRVNLLEDMVSAWSEASLDIVKVLDGWKMRGDFSETRLKIVEVATRVIEAVGYGNAVLPAHQRTGLLKAWLPSVRQLKAELLNVDDELCNCIEMAMTSLLLSLPSGDQAEILAEWLKSEHAKFPDFTEAFEVWCFRSKAANRRLQDL